MATLTHAGTNNDPGAIYWFGMTSLSVLLVVLLAVLFALSPWSFDSDAQGVGGASQAPAAETSAGP